MRRNYILFFIALLAVNLYQWITIVESTYGIPKIVKYALSAFAIGTLIYNRITKPSKPNPGGLFYAVIVVFSIWSVLFIFFSVLKFDSVFYIQLAFADPYFFIPYLLPLLLLFTKTDIEFFRYYFQFATFLIFPAILMQFLTIIIGLSQITWAEQVARIGIFDMYYGYLLLTAYTLKKKYVSRIILIYFFIMLFLYSYYGRRGVLVEYSVLFVFMILLMLRSSLLTFNDRIKIYFAGLVFVILLLAFGYLATSSYAFQRGFSKEAVYESRGSVYEDFFLDFNTTSDWIFGRGIDGKILRSINLEAGTSNTIENGFLTVILKGGLLYMIPFVLILLKASYLGFFKSKNEMVKALAAMIFIYVVMMAYFNLPVFSTKYILIWVSATICFNKEIRNYENDEVYARLNI